MHICLIYVPFIALLSYVTVHGQTLHTKDALGHQILAHIRVQNFEIIPSLIAAGANLEVRDTIFGYTPLLRAIREAPTKIILQLLQAGADPNANDNNGKTALQHVLNYKKDMSIAVLLAHAGIDLDAPGHHEKDNNTPLLVQAAYDDKHALSEWLLLRGASPLTEEARNHLALHNCKDLRPYNKCEEAALQRTSIITQGLEANGFARDITHLFWDIAGLPQKYKPPTASYKKGPDNSHNFHKKKANPLDTLQVKISPK